MTRERLIFIGQWTLVALLAAALTVAVTKPIILTASDMGRHLMNGKLFLDHGEIATTNLYSYTHPDFPFLNHHWGSGVVFELARRFRGFVGVSMVGSGLVLLSTFLYLRIAWLRGSLWLTAAASALVLGVFAGRAEVRPELFSYLFSAIFLWVLFGARDGSISRKALAILPVLTLAWVNLHIYFFLGIGWIGAFLVDALFRAWRDDDGRAAHLAFAKQLAITLAGVCLCTVFNPNGWQGAVYPLFIFRNYAYAVSENQSVSLIHQQGPYPPADYFRAALVVLAASWAWRFYRDRRRGEVSDVALFILSAFVSIVAWKAIRNFTIFSYVSIVALSYLWSDVDLDRFGRKAIVAKVLVPLAVFGAAFAYWPSFWGAVYHTMGFGVAPGILRSIDFFKEQGLKGPIFNNYDIGGFLTYGLYPEERVFVDNRPEAYPGTFFTENLLPMQLNDEVWQRVDAQVRFNVIFFYRHDATRWGQAFMIRRLNDPAWAPVFVDGFVLVLLRRTPENEGIIEKFEIPKSRFEVRERDR